MLDASVAVFCANEAAHIEACITGVARAAAGMRVSVTIIANGSTDGSAALAMATAKRHGLPARAAAIAYPDKSNAINHALTTLREPADLHVFVDGYAVMGDHALVALGAALDRSPDAQASTGVATGPGSMAALTAATLRDGGRLHGQLHALRPGFVDRLTQAGFFLPVGLYRGDGLLGSMVCHDLDALGTPWDPHRIAGASQATYSLPRPKPWRPADARRLFRRRVRQMRGRMENEAIKSVIYAQGYQGLPDYADDMIAAWLAQGGQVACAAADRPFQWLARRQARRPEAGELKAVLL